MGQAGRLACRVCKGASKVLFYKTPALLLRLEMEVPFLFTYRELKIISAAPISQITDYLKELGAVPTETACGLKYELAGLEIDINQLENDPYPDIGAPRHTIEVHGDNNSAQDFLTAFRLRFLSAGG